MITCTRRFEWDSAHRVLGHGGKCRFLHGHRYAAEITVQAIGLDELGMVIDFSVLKEKVGGWIDANWDHNILLHPQDPLLRSQVWDATVFGDRKPYVFIDDFGNAKNPTAENIAVDLYIKTRELLPEGMDIVRVRVYETPNCYADYIPHYNPNILRIANADADQLTGS